MKCNGTIILYFHTVTPTATLPHYASGSVTGIMSIHSAFGVASLLYVYRSDRYTFGFATNSISRFTSGFAIRCTPVDPLITSYSFLSSLALLRSFRSRLLRCALCLIQRTGFAKVLFLVFLVLGGIIDGHKLTNKNHSQKVLNKNQIIKTTK